MHSARLLKLQRKDSGVIDHDGSLRDAHSSFLRPVFRIETTHGPTLNITGAVWAWWHLYRCAGYKKGRHAVMHARRRQMAKGQEKPGKMNKPKLSTKEKADKKKAKKETKG